MTTSNCWLVVLLAVGTVVGPVTVGVAGNAEATVTENAVDSHALAGFDAGTDTMTTVPTAVLEASPNPARPGDTVRWDATDSTTDDGEIVECDFDLDGDGTIDVFGDDDCIVTRQYNQTGEYKVAVRVRDTTQQTDTDTETLIVTQNQPPVADFSWSPPTPTPGESVDFNASDSEDSDGDIVEYRWVSEDGSIDTITQLPLMTHTFDEPGTYPVTLTVMDDEGATDSITQEVPVEGDPDARCSVSNTEVEPNDQITIDASDSNADLVRIDVDGDGEFDRTNDDDFREVVTYADPGNYTPVVRAQISQRIDTQQCQPITVEENERPDAAFTVNPEPGTVGDPMSFDASDSEDPDGEIVEYRWDWNNDNNFEDTTTVDTVTHTFDEPGSKTVQLLVVDDDDTTDLAVIQGIVVQEATTPTPIPDLDASCTVSKDEVVPEEPVVIGVSGPELRMIEFDTDGDGTYDADITVSTSITERYDDTGIYEPSVRVTDERQRTAVVDCGTISVVEPEEDQRPDAQLTHRPATPERDETVVLDATGSYDPDGHISVYRWDLDNDGDVESTTSEATVTHTFDEAGNHTVRVVVADDDGATDETTDVVDVSGGICGYIPPPFTPSETVCAFIPPLVLLGGGGLGGLMICRVSGRLRSLFGGEESEGGLTDYAAGTVELPAAGATVSVTDLGFEPDLVLLTASNAVVTAGPGHVGDTSVGWSYGVAERKGDGDIAQHVVSVAEDARYPDFATAAASDGHAVYLATFDGERVDGVKGRIERTTEEGFELSVPATDTAASAADAANRSDGRPVVLYRAFETEHPEDVDVGYFRTPAEPTEQSVEIDPAANHVTLTTCTALADFDVGRATERTVGISTGEVVGGETLQQVVTAGAVAPSTEGFSGTAAAKDRAIHLLHQAGPVVDGRTTASATSLDEGLDLEYDAVHADESTLQSGGQPLVSYAAINADGAVPTVGYIELTGPDENGAQSVATGFEPGLVEFTVCDIGEPGERVGSAGPYPWGRSHGVAMETDDGVDQYLLHGAVDPDWNVREASGSADGIGAAGVGASLAANGGSEAHITGRDDLEVTAFTVAGFDVRTTHISTEARDPGADEGKLVFYKAWPKPAQ